MFPWSAIIAALAGTLPGAIVGALHLTGQTGTIIASALGGALTAIAHLIPSTQDTANLTAAKIAPAVPPQVLTTG